jgi:ADP-heptose:LPS heptosyltransferase
MRSIPLPLLNPLGDIAGVVFHSLQWGEPAAEAWASDHRLPLCNRHEPIPVDLVVLAQAIAQMDLVVSVDTMVAHLAGALGKPVWVLLLRTADWRWMMDRQDSPWYPTMRLFRQSVHRDWSHPVTELARALQTHNVLRERITQAREEQS